MSERLASSSSDQAGCPREGSPKPMQPQGENGLTNLPGRPNESTLRAWQTLAPPLLHDQGIMLELFNEPSRANWDEARKEWAREMQMLIDGVRKMGSTNILLLHGLGYAQ